MKRHAAVRMVVDEVRTPTDIDRGNGITEVASARARTTTNFQKAGRNQSIVVPPVSRELYTDMPAMANTVLFGVPSVGNRGRANSFATGSVSGATVFTQDGLGQQSWSLSEKKKVSFPLNAEQKKVGGASLPGSSTSRVLRKQMGGTPGPSSGGGGKTSGCCSSIRERGGLSATSAEINQGRGQGMHRGGRKGEHQEGAKSCHVGARPGVSKAKSRSFSDSGEERKAVLLRGGSSEALLEGGSPKAASRSALFKKWLNKNIEGQRQGRDTVVLLLDVDGTGPCNGLSST